MDSAIKQDVGNTIKKVLEIFTVQYTKAYVLALVRHIKIESQKKPEPWLLEERPAGSWTEDLKTGYLVKEGAVRKNWKKRYFVVKNNFTVDYFESDTMKKRKGTMSLSGYTVVEDPNQGILVRLKRLAEKMGVDFSNLPKPKEYAPLVFEVYHPRRRCYYIQASNKEEFDEWVAEFKKVCWRARGWTIDEECHQYAFQVAVRKTRWELGRWGWYYGYGSEEQILSDLISDELEYDIMGRIYSKLSGPWVMRSMLRNQAIKLIDAMVSAAVKPAWAGMAKTVKEVRPKIEPKIRELTEPIFKAENEITEKMKNAVMSVIDPILQEHVCPHLGKIVSILKSPFNEALAECYRLFDERVRKWEPHSDKELKQSFREQDWLPRSYWEMRPATDKTEVMYEPLWALHLIFSDIYPWGLIWKSHNELRRITDNAVWTWETILVNKQEKEGKGADKEESLHALDSVLQKFKHDGDILATNYYCDIMKTIVMPPFEALIQPAAKAIIDPLADAIPEPLREFIDIKQMFEDLYNSIVDATIETVVRSDQPPQGSPAPLPAAVSSSGEESSDSEEEDKDHSNGVTGPVFIHSRNSNLVLDVQGGSLSAGTPIILWPKKDSDNSNQQWLVDSEGFVSLAARPELVLGYEKDGERQVILQERKESENHHQKWKREGEFFASVLGGVLDVKGGSSENGATLLIWEKKPSDNANQQFYFTQ